MDITKSDVLACRWAIKPGLGLYRAAANGCNWNSEIRSARESECYQKAQLLSTLLPNVEMFKKTSSWLNTRCVREHAIRSTRVRFAIFPWRILSDC